MTEEECFMSAIESNPLDSINWLVYADWLEDRQEQRSGGIRAMGSLGKYPQKFIHKEYLKPDIEYWSFWWLQYTCLAPIGEEHSWLPEQWFARMVDRGPWWGQRPGSDRSFASPQCSFREATEYAILAFNEIPPAVRETILADCHALFIASQWHHGPTLPASDEVPPASPAAAPRP